MASSADEQCCLDSEINSPDWRRRVTVRLAFVLAGLALIVGIPTAIYWMGVVGTLNQESTCHTYSGVWTWFPCFGNGIIVLVSLVLALFVCVCLPLAALGGLCRACAWVFCEDLVKPEPTPGAPETPTGDSPTKQPPEDSGAPLLPPV